jgi:hypothetical protein
MGGRRRSAQQQQQQQPQSASEAEAAARRAEKEAYLGELKRRYATGALPLRELVEVRRSLCTALYDAQLAASHERTLTMERQLQATITEEMAMRAGDYNERLSESIAVGTAWCERWRAALAVLAQQEEEESRDVVAFRRE